MKKLILSVVLIFSSFLAHANILGNMQTLAPNPDSLFFQNVHSSKTLAKNYFNVGFFVAYVRNELSSYDDLVTPDFLKYKDESLTYDFIAAWGVTNRLEVFYAAPGFLDQKPDSGQVQNKYVTKGINVHRPGLKYDLSDDNSGGYAVVASIDFPMTVDDPYVGNDPKPIYNLELARDFRRTEDAFAINLGYRFRQPGDTPTNSYFFPLKDQFIGSFAYAYGIRKNWRFHAEIYGATAANKDPHPEQKHASALEGLLGYKQKLFTNFWAHVGATAELMPEGLAPDYRIYAGLNYYFGFAESKASEPLSVQPSSLQLDQNAKQKIEVAGGEKPYRYRLAEPFGTFDESQLEYQAPAHAGQTKLIVQDARSGRVDVPIAVKGEANDIVAPEQVELYEGSKIKIPVRGGAAPLKFAVDNNFGFYDKDQETYLAPTRTGETQLVVTDANQKQKIVRILVKEIPQAKKEIVIRNLKFVFNTSSLTNESENLLERNINQFQEKPIRKMIIIGHTDSVGRADYNQKLSLDRAQAVANHLKNRLSLKDDQVEAVGYGQDRPIDTNDTPLGRQNNRRVEFKVFFVESAP